MMGMPGLDFTKNHSSSGISEPSFLLRSSASLASVSKRSKTFSSSSKA